MNILKRYLPLALLLFIACMCPGAMGKPQTATDCGNSTVTEAWGPEFASRAEAFLAEVQHAVEKNDATKFASLVRYPVRINGTRAVKISTAAQLIKRYPTLMTPSLSHVILSQSAACLFGNYQGVMIGNGQVWFAEQPDGKMKIIAINADQSR